MFSRLLDWFRRGSRPTFSLPPDDELKDGKSGLRYQVVREGAEEGKLPRVYDKATVRYVGWTSDGVLFDASYPRTTTFGVDRVIKGFSQGLQLMREGAIHQLVIPPNLAYGPRGVPPRIGPNATLVFYVELVAVT